MTADGGPVAPDAPEIDDGIDDAALAAALADVPRGAIALGGTAVVLLMICWFLVYFLIFLPRGSIG